MWRRYGGAGRGCGGGTARGGEKGREDEERETREEVQVVQKAVGYWSWRSYGTRCKAPEEAVDVQEH